MIRGTKPRSTATKRIQGNPGRRPLNSSEPLLPAGLEDNPIELAGDERARLAWRRLVPMLAQARQVTAGDRDVLIALCQQWSFYLEMWRKARRRPVRRAGKSAYRTSSEYLPLANKALVHCRALWETLGLTPSSRSRLGVAFDSKAGDPFSKFDEPTGATAH